MDKYIKSPDHYPTFYIPAGYPTLLPIVLHHCSIIRQLFPLSYNTTCYPTSIILHPYPPPPLSIILHPPSPGPLSYTPARYPAPPTGPLSSVPACYHAPLPVGVILYTPPPRPVILRPCPLHFLHPGRTNIAEVAHLGGEGEVQRAEGMRR